MGLDPDAMNPESFRKLEEAMRGLKKAVEADVLPSIQRIGAVLEKMKRKARYERAHGVRGRR